MTGTLSFDAMAKADPGWRKGLSKRYFEVDSAVKEMTERAAAELEATGQQVSAMKHAKIMDAEGAEHGKGKGKGTPTPVATWVKNVLGPIRAQRNKQRAGARHVVTTCLACIQCWQAQQINVLCVCTLL